MTSGNVTLKRPHFFQIIFEEYPGKGLEKLWIPRRFMRIYGRKISKHVKVKDPTGKKWIMEWSKSDRDIWFKKGWQEFADYYCLKHGHLLVLKYKGNSRFSLVILDKTATEIAYPIKGTASAPSLTKQRKESSVKYSFRPRKMMTKNVAEDFKGLPHNVKGVEVVEKNGCDRDSDLIITELEVPDSDFKDFEEDRQEQCFKVGQVWAVYDSLDCMPRYYARINKVFFQGIFKVKVTWLEASPDNRDQLEWIERGLPTPCCGIFKHGTTDYLDRRMFSHLMFCENGSRRNTYKILPRKGETWAVFKNGNIKASIHSGYFEYEFVEILSEYREGVGVFVAYLSKVMGFVSIFCRPGKDGFVITDDELYRFSHQVPSFKLIGNDKFSVMKESFELDPAALPLPLWTIKEIYFCS